MSTPFTVYRIQYTYTVYGTVYELKLIILLFRTQTKVEFGFEDYFLEVQQFVTIEILNHEDEKVRLAKIEQLYGPC